MTTKNESEISLIEWLGSDYTVVESARVSTGNAGRKGDEADRKLLKYLWKNEHLSPFEQVNFRFHLKTPIFIARQLMRHRTFRFNEASARYKEMPTEFFLPKRFREQAGNNKQGSGSDMDDTEQSIAWSLTMKAYEACEGAYEIMLERGVARELARIVLPVGLMTELVFSVDLRNLLHFVRLRDSDHAQPEIREIAVKMKKLIKPIVPWTIEAFEEEK
jgi:thymidylate synthase (FAD)